MPQQKTATAEPAAGPELGLRELKKRRTRGEIIDATVALVAEHGLDGTTIEMIADRAGVSGRTFFNYFDTKAEAVLARAADTFGRLPGILADRPAAENPLLAIRETFCEFAGSTVLGAADDRRMRVILDSNPGLKVELDRVFEALGDQLKAELVRRTPDDPDAPTTAAVAVSVGFGLLWLAYRDSVTVPDGSLSAARLREHFDVLARHPLTF